MPVAITVSTVSAVGAIPSIDIAFESAILVPMLVTGKAIGLPARSLNSPPVVDTEGSPITDKKTPLYGGSTVKLGFYQKPYILKDGVTYGSSLKLVGVQVVSVKGDAGVDTGELNEAEVADLFGKTDGFKATDAPPENAEDTEDF